MCMFYKKHVIILLAGTLKVGRLFFVRLGGSQRNIYFMMILVFGFFLLGISESETAGKELLKMFVVVLFKILNHL